MPSDYPARLHELCREHGILYVDDEVQSGVGRTGKMWAIEHYDGVEPDLLVSGKSIGGGLPLAAVTGRAELMDAVPAGGLGGTFGGNPLSCAAAVAVLEAVREPEFLARATSLGETLRDAARRAREPTRRDRRGARARPDDRLRARGADARPAKSIVDAAFERGLLLLSCGLYGNVIRLLPALTISDAELDEGLGAARRIARGRCVTETPDIRIRGLVKRFGDVTAVDAIDLDIARGEFFTMLGPSGLGEDDDAQDDRGVRDPRRGGDRAARDATSPGCRRTTARSTPSSRTTRSFRTCPSPRTSSTGCRVKKVAKDERRRRADGGARDGPPRRLRRAEAGAALGRAAAAGGARPRDRQRAAGAASRRAPRSARPEAPPGDADRAQADPAGGRDHVRLRDPRPGGSAHDERPDRGVQPRPDRAGRPARGGVRASARASSSPGSSGSRTSSSGTVAATRCGRRRFACWPKALRRRTACTWRQGWCATCSTSAR